MSTEACRRRTAAAREEGDRVTSAREALGVIEEYGEDPKEHKCEEKQNPGLTSANNDASADVGGARRSGGPEHGAKVPQGVTRRRKASKRVAGFR